MTRLRFILGAWALLGLAAAQTPAGADHVTAATPAKGAAPAYHAHPPGPLPAVQPPSKYQDPRVRNIYALAAKIKPVLYQLPCYCRCDKTLGHRSLLDCYVSDHASVCEVCLMEAAFAYQETRKGKTPAQIREEIENGDWHAINVNDYIHSCAGRKQGRR